MRIAKPIFLPYIEQIKLFKLARKRSTPKRLTDRYRIVLLAAEGFDNDAIAATLGVTRQMVARWRLRFLATGLEAFGQDRQRMGRPAMIDSDQVEEVLRQTFDAPDRKYSRRPLSTRLMANLCGISPSSVRLIWQKHQIRPHWARGFSDSSNYDKSFVSKMDDVVGLYMDAYDHALVLSERRTPRSKAGSKLCSLHNGTIFNPPKIWVRKGKPLLKSLYLSTTEAATPHPKNAINELSLVEFLRRISESHPEGVLNVIVKPKDNDKRKQISSWSKDRPRLIIHFLPTSFAWQDMVDNLFSNNICSSCYPGSFSSVSKLFTALCAYVDIPCGSFSWKDSDPASIYKRS
jgi:transposase